jgi:SAM-dependent methyltransferase
MQLQKHEDLWDDEAAKSYDTPGTGMFAADVLGPVIDRLQALAGEGPVVEFAIGTGRVAIPLLERGLKVGGIEIAPAMIAQLRTKVDERTLPVVLGDMTTARLPGDYSMVYLVFNGISCLMTQAEQVECFRNAARHLKSGGRFVIELWVPTIPRPSEPQAVVFQARDGYIGLDTVDPAAQHVVSHHFNFGQSKEARLFRSPHRYIWPSELDLMGQLAGFELESRHADWLGSPFTGASQSHISVYRLTAGEG